MVPWSHAGLLDSGLWSPGALRSRSFSPVRSVCGSRIATREGCRGAANERPLCGRGSAGSRVSRAMIGRIVYNAAPVVVVRSFQYSYLCVRTECRLQYLGRLGSQDEGVKLQGGGGAQGWLMLLGPLGPWDFWIARLSPSWRFVIDGRLVFWGGGAGGGQLGQSGLDSRGGAGVPSPSSTQISECRAPGRQAEAEAVAVGGMDGQKASDVLGGYSDLTSPHSRLTRHTHLHLHASLPSLASNTRAIRRMQAEPGRPAPLTLTAGPSAQSLPYRVPEGELWNGCESHRRLRLRDH